MSDANPCANRCDQAERWARALCDAWKDGDVELADGLVAESFGWHEITGITVIDSHTALNEYWAAEGNPQLELELWLRRPHVTDRGAVAEFWSTMFYVGHSERYLPPDPVPLETHGGVLGRPLTAVWAMIATLDDAGRAVEINQYHYLIPGGIIQPPDFWDTWYHR